MIPQYRPLPPLLRVTRAQARALAAVALSESRADAAGIIGSSAYTVRAHLTATYERLGVRSLTGALWRMGWLEVPADLLDLPAREPVELVWITGLGEE